MSEAQIPELNIDRTASPQIYNPPPHEGVSCWRLKSLAGDCVEVGGYHGYTGFFSDFMINWVCDGEAIVTFEGYRCAGCESSATYQLKIRATSSAEEAAPSE
jgi:hypothetical protein